MVADRVATGAATLGEAVLVLSLAGQLHAQLGRVIGEVGQLAAAGEVLEHYAWVRAHGAGQPGGGAAQPPRRLTEGIVLTGVGLRYPGMDRDALCSVDLVLPAGSTVAVVGVNGAGKTTLVKLLTGMYRPARGRILVDGRPLEDLRQQAWRARICAVFQDFVRFNLLAGEAVGVGNLSQLRNESAVRAALARAGADGLPDALPHGLRTQLGTAFDGIEPSLGQWQKLALARALMRPAPLLAVLDEPTAALDAQAEHELFTRFTVQTRELAARYGTITVLVSHRFSTVRIADLIVVVAGGRVVERGNHDTLVALGGVYAQMYREQAAAYLGAPAVGRST
jgi:ATP-binding cassette subfamily B protein